MRRREFITLIGGAAAWPLVARAQQAGKLPTIGVLGGATAVAESQRTAALVQRVRELGRPIGWNWLLTLGQRCVCGKILRPGRCSTMSTRWLTSWRRSRALAQT